MEKTSSFNQSPNKPPEPNRVEKPVIQDGNVVGYERGEAYNEFPLKKLEERPHYQCEFETKSGNKYILKANTGESPDLNNIETPFIIVNTKTGETSPMTRRDIENGLIKVGQPFMYGGSGRTTVVKNILFYEKGKIHY